MDPVLLILAAPVLVALFLLGRRYLRSRGPGRGWRIGPLIRGKNYSVGLPGKPQALGVGWQVDLPVGASIHYVTRDCDGLPLGGILRARLRIDGHLATQLWPTERPGASPLVSLHFQRKGDDWSARGKYASYRWYSQDVWPAVVGDFIVLQTPLSYEFWKSVVGEGQSEPGFRDALREAERIGFTFGHSGGRGHGVSTDRLVTVICDRFEIL